MGKPECRKTEQGKICSYKGDLKRIAQWLFYEKTGNKEARDEIGLSEEEINEFKKSCGRCAGMRVEIRRILSPIDESEPIIRKILKDLFDEGNERGPEENQEKNIPEGGGKSLGKVKVKRVPKITLKMASKE